VKWPRAWGQLVELSVTRGFKRGKLKIYLGRSRYQETVSEDCNRLRTLVPVCVDL
jgi:hypothetical protein